MNLQDHSRSIGLRCSTCAGTMFKRDPGQEDGPITCVGCERVFTKDELIRENSEAVELAVEEARDDLVADIKAQFRQAFAGSKIIKVR